MPIYEFCCSDCSRNFEKIVWNSDDKTVQCPYCQGEKVIRLLSSFSKAGGRSGNEISSATSCGPSGSGFS